jgi:hypothetical protein
MGEAYTSIVEQALCKVPDELGGMGFVAMLCAAVLYAAVLVR